MYKKLILMVLGVALLSACTTTRYEVRLDKVERPQSVHEPYGKSKTAHLTPETTDGLLQYADEHIFVKWELLDKSFNMTLKNLTDHTIYIHWDKVVYVDPWEYSWRCVYGSTKVIGLTHAQVPSAVARHSMFSETLVPAANVNISDLSKPAPIFASFASQSSADESGLIGKPFSIILPIEIEGDVNEYVFQFTVTDIKVTFEKVDRNW